MRGRTSPANSAAAEVTKGLTVTARTGRTSSPLGAGGEHAANAAQTENKATSWTPRPGVVCMVADPKVTDLLVSNIRSLLQCVNRRLFRLQHWESRGLRAKTRAGGRRERSLRAPSRKSAL